MEEACGKSEQPMQGTGPPAEPPARIAKRRKCVIRCTGDVDTCDGCKTHQIACVVSDSIGRRRKRARTGNDAALDRSKHSRLSPASSPISQDQDAAQLTPQASESAEWGWLADEFRAGAWGNGESITTGSERESPVASHPQSRVVPYNTPPDCSPNNNGGTISGPEEDHSLGSTPSLAAQRQDSESNGDAPCSCVDNTLHLIQRLDDDEFCLKKLSVDQLLKLQKYLVFQCVQPLQCNQCASNTGAQGAVLIVCGRIINMSECLSNRLKRLLNGLSMSAQKDRISVFEILQRPDILHAPDEDFTNDNHEGSTALFNGQTGQAGYVAKCTLHLFSPEFRGQYSSDEQCQMIQVLARMQIDNCARLLKRLGSMCGSHHQARSERIRAMEKRLQDAGSSTDESLEAISQAFSPQI